MSLELQLGLSIDIAAEQNTIQSQSQLPYSHSYSRDCPLNELYAIEPLAHLQRVGRAAVLHRPEVELDRIVQRRLQSTPISYESSRHQKQNRNAARGG